MTLIIAAEGEGFVVLAADSKGTWIDDIGSRMESITEEKLIPITKFTCVLIADDAELGVQLVEEFKARNKTISDWGITKVVQEFSVFCKKELLHITDTIQPTSDAFPSVTFLIAGLDKNKEAYIPKINILRSKRLFLAGRHKDKVAEGKPLIARYILSKRYERILSQENMGFIVAEAMKETISVDGDVGGKVRMAIIDENGVRVLTDNVVEKYLDGQEEDEKNRLNQEQETLEEMARG